MIEKSKIKSLHLVFKKIIYYHDSSQEHWNPNLLLKIKWRLIIANTINNTGIENHKDTSKDIDFKTVTLHFFIWFCNQNIQ